MRLVEKIIVLLLLVAAVLIPACAQRETGSDHGMMQEVPTGAPRAK